MGKGKRWRSDSSSSSSDYDSDDYPGSQTKRQRQEERGETHRGARVARSRRRVKDSKDDRHRPSAGDQINVDEHFYLKSREFRHWLLHGRSKPKQFAKMEARDQRKYFKRFAKRWNKGKLDRIYYDGSFLQDSDQPTSHNASHLLSRGGEGNVVGAPSMGPGRPTLDELALQHDRELDARAAIRDAERAEHKRSRREAKQEERENRATGRDRLQEKRAEKRASNKEFASAREQGDMEFGEDYLMGGSSSSFAEAIRRRDAAKANSASQRKAMERQAAVGEKRAELQKKEDATMAMFKAMAAAKYGTG